MKQSMVSRAMALAMVLVVLAGSVKGVTGQGPGPEQGNVAPAGVSIEAAVASRISYQGMLKESGAPVTGSRDMTFRLHRNSACTSQVGFNIVKDGVPVTAGLFTVALDVPQSDFNGQALWLQVVVGGVNLGCHEITATPYALSLRPGALISDTLSGPVLMLANISNGTGIRSLTGDGKVGDLHPPFYNAAGEFAGFNGVIGAASAFAVDGNGVIGLAQGTSGRGVHGRATASSGTTFGGHFVSYSESGTGVYGEANANSGATLGGHFVSSSIQGRGVFGQATDISGTNYGVFGESYSLANDAAGGYFSAGPTETASQSDGVVGLAYGRNTQAFGVAGWAYLQGVGVGAWSYSGNIMEGYQGDYPGGTQRMYLTGAGNLYIDGTYNTYATAADGSEKVLYGTQSTEVWVEDFGTGQLAEGLGTVKIAADFAKTVNLTAEYHVFLTPMGDCALYVAEKTATSFTVRAIDGKACSIAFDYRLVAKQAGLESYRMTEIADPPAPEKVEEGPVGP